MYTRKTERKSWSSDNLKTAIEAVNGGSSIRKAARDFNIPETTIRDNMKRALPSDSLGRKATFTPEQEQELVNHVIKLANLFYGVTPLGLRKIAYDFAAKNNIEHRFNDQKQLAGKDWLYLFIKRNPRISLRQPEGTSINRISSFNAEAVKLFFFNLEKMYSKFHFAPNRVYNCDETGISNVPNKSAKIYAARGSKQVGVATSGERGRNVTVMCCMNAAGGYIPPMFIYPRKRMSPILETGGPIGAIYCCSDNGWMNQVLFLSWLEHFNKHAKPSLADPVLLVCDNHGSHISLAMYDFCKEHHIHVVSLPPHTSHKTQPLDVSLFGPLKNAFYRECDLYLKMTGHEKINMSDLSSLFNKAYVKVATMSKCESGFRSTGIFPLNVDQFTADDFAPAEQYHNMSIEHDLDETNIQTKPVDGRAASASTGEGQIATMSSIQDPVPCTSALTSSEEQSLSEPNSSFVSVQDVAPIPKKGFRKIIKKGGRKKQHSEILTGTPMKIKLIENQKKNESKLIKTAAKKDKNKSKGKKVGEITKKKANECESETDESDIDMPDVIDDDDDMELEDVMDNENECLICGEFGRNKEMWFRCVVCGRWAHQECSGWDSAEDYKCDFCFKPTTIRNEKRILRF